MRPGKWAWLGGLRFFLAAVVVATHLGVCSDPSGPAGKLSGLVGFNAVLCFFLISGYSISCSIRQRPGGFLRRRFLRIYPIYLLCVLLALVPWISRSTISTYDGGLFTHPSTGQALAGLFLLQGFLAPVIESIGPSWSLSVECAYYLLAPLLARLKPLLPWIAVAASFLYFRLGGHADFPNQSGLVPFASLIWAWLLGWLYERGPKPADGPRGLLFGLFFVAAAGYGIYGLPLPPFHPGVQLMPYAVGAAIAIAPAVHLPGPAYRLLDYLGELSYPWYLVHTPVFYLIRVYGTPEGLLSNPWIALGLSLAAAALLLHGVDFPLRRKERTVHTAPAFS